MIKIKNNINILGIMNGTSLDGIDYVLCNWSDAKQELKLVGRASKVFPKELLNSLQACARNKANVETLAKTHYQLGKMYKKHIGQLMKSKNWKIDFVALHGQTVFHEGKMASMQIGDPSYISKELDIPCIYDFRSGDIALGGQGAPLAGLFHEFLSKTKLKSRSVAFHNLGGISNLTYINGKTKICFDTGPANMLMDLFIKKYSKGEKSFDKSGKLASSGEVDSVMLSKMLSHKYFKKKAPKSCGREEFGEEFLNKYYKQLKSLGLNNALATLNWFTAYSIFDSYRKFLPNMPERIFLCGGGANNTHLRKNLNDLFLGNSEILDVTDLGIGLNDMEAMAFAYLGVCFLKGKKLNLPQHTGASKKDVLGKLSI